jgi:type VI protein secretion system component VasK
MNREEDNWHLSRSVPITLIFGLIAQAAAIVWTVSMMMSDIERNTEEIMRMQSRLASVEDATQRQAISMARIDENIKAIRQSVEKMANEK